MDLKGMTPSEISQRKKNTVWAHLYVESERKKKKNFHRYREQTGGYQRREWGGKGGEVVEGGQMV